MTVNALYPDYVGQVRDVESNFHGNRVLYVSWLRHLMFTNPYAFLVQPDMPFGQFVSEALAPAFGSHPDWEKISWPEVVWYRGEQPVAIDFSATLRQLGLNHKTALQFSTPGLDGLRGLGI